MAFELIGMFAQSAVAAFALIFVAGAPAILVLAPVKA